MDCKLVWFFCLLGVLLALPVLSAQNPAHRPVLMISIDGLRPDYVTQADQHGLKIPALRGFLRNGLYADEVVGVLPTMTYPSHTALMTGVWPAVHGIENNVVFDPLGQNDGSWNWYGQTVKATTLWLAAHAAGLVMASVYRPVTVSSHGIGYNVPEYFRARNGQDRYLEEAISSPTGFLEEIESQAVPFEIGHSDTPFDEIVTQTSIAVIRSKHPSLLTIHLVSLDHNEHAAGPFSARANDALEAINGMVGRIMEKERRAHPDADILVVSDHGFLPIDHRVNLNAPLADAGLITVKAGAKPMVTSWKAMAWNAGGAAAIYLNDPQDAATRKRVGDLLEAMKTDPSYGIAQVLMQDQLRSMGGFSRHGLCRGLAVRLLRRRSAYGCGRRASSSRRRARLSTDASGVARVVFCSRSRHCAWQGRWNGRHAPDGSNRRA